MAGSHLSTSGPRRGRLRVRIITPAIIGGPNRRVGDPISPMRIPSLRGVWRWWFRAGLGSVLCPSSSEQTARKAMLNTMRALETRLFGATDRASMLLMRPARLLSGAGRVRLPPPDRNHKGQSYLSYGVFDRRQETYALKPGSEYELRFRLRSDPEGQEELLMDALRATLWAWSTFGGLGARSRRGWGSVEILSTELDGAPWVWQGDDLRQPEGINGLLNATVKGLQQLFADFSALSRSVNFQPSQGKPLVQMRTLAGLKRIVPLRHHLKPLEALEQAGARRLRFRSTLARGRARLRPLPDYFEVKAAIQNQPGAPRRVERAAFGLPLPFYFRSLGGQKSRFIPKTPGADRLASPLQVRVRPITLRGEPYYVPLFADLSERAGADPLLEQGIRMNNRRIPVPRPNGGLISTFLDWAHTQASQPRPQRGRR